MKFRLFVLLLLLDGLRLPAAEPDPALLDRGWLREVLHYSYYWYLDDAFFAAVHDEKEIVVSVRSVEPQQRDPGDGSRYAEIWLPQAKVMLSAKKSDYRIEELDLPVRSTGYRVVRGGYEDAPPGDPAEWREVRFPRQELLEEFTAVRGHLHAPRPAVREVAEVVIRRELARHPDVRGPQKFYLAARTDVSAQIWIFWEDRRMLFQVTGDMDAVTGAVAHHLPVRLRRFDLGQNVVASTIEMQGRNAFISRDLASRALFVCVARGEAMVVEP